MQLQSSIPYTNNDNVSLIVYAWDTEGAFNTISRYYANRDTGFLEFTIPEDTIGLWIRINIHNNDGSLNNVIHWLYPIILDQLPHDIVDVESLIENKTSNVLRNDYIHSNVYESCDDVIDQGILFVSSGGGVRTIPDFPLNQAGWLYNSFISNNIKLQIAFPFNINTGKILIKTKSFSWNEWREFIDLSNYATKSDLAELEAEKIENPYIINLYNNDDLESGFMSNPVTPHSTLGTTTEYYHTKLIDISAYHGQKLYHTANTSRLSNTVMFCSDLEGSNSVIYHHNNNLSANGKYNIFTIPTNANYMMIQRTRYEVNLGTCMECIGGYPDDYLPYGSIRLNNDNINFDTRINYREYVSYKLDYNLTNKYYKITVDGENVSTSLEDTDTSDPKYVTYLIMLNKLANKYLFIKSEALYNKNYITIHDENGNYISTIKSISEIDGITVFELPEDCISVGITYNTSLFTSGYKYPGIIGSAPDMLPIIDQGSLLESSKLIFDGRTIVNKNPQYVIDFTTLKYCNSVPYDNINYYDTEDTNYVSTPKMYFPKGTRLCCGTSKMGVEFALAGVNYAGPVYYSKTECDRDFIIPYDFYGNIIFNDAPWLNYPLPLMSLKQKAQFMIIQSPEDQSHNQWKNKKWVSFGTSISDVGVGDTASFNGATNSSGKWPLYIDIVSGMERINMAIGSGGLVSKTDDLNVKKNIHNCPLDADLVTLELGPNDYFSGWRNNLGEYTDTTNASYLGMINQILNYLTRHTHAKIVFVFIGDVVSTAVDGNYGVADNQEYVMLSEITQERRIKYREYVDKVKYLASLYGCAVIDVDGEAIAYAQRVRGGILQDQVHPSYLGGWIAGNYIWQHLKLLTPYFDYPERELKSTINEIPYDESTTLG